MPNLTRSGTEKELRSRLRGSLLAWSEFALAPQGLVPARHHRLMVAELEAVARGRVDRLMLLLPPGHAKSTYTKSLSG